MREPLPIFESVVADFRAGRLEAEQGRHEWRRPSPRPRHSSGGLDTPTIEVPKPRKES